MLLVAYIVVLMMHGITNVKYRLTLHISDLDVRLLEPLQPEINVM